MQHLYKNMQIDQWNKIESPEIDEQCMFNRFLRYVPKQFIGERIIPSTNCTEQPGYPRAKIVTLISNSTQNTARIIDLNMKMKTIKF